MVIRLLIVGNSTEYFVSHRLPIAVAALQEGYEVHVATPEEGPISQILDHGFVHHPLVLSRSGKNPFKEVQSILALFRLMRSIRPSVVHAVTVKPVLYGGVAARIARVPSMVAAITGLGSVFMAGGLKANLIRFVVECGYRLALGHSHSVVIFQNLDDKAELLSIGAVREQQTRLIRGSGVRIDEYPCRPEPDGIPVVTMAARLLVDKGVREFVEAARLLRQRGVATEFRLIGEPDPGNPATVSRDEVEEWRDEGIVKVLGFRRDIAEQYSQSHIVCLPSYREGLPKSLVEAAACGRAVVTTDVPGCRDAIEPGRSGLLVPVRDIVALADAIAYLIQNPNERRAMGATGRNLAEREFAIEKIVDQHLALYREFERKNA